jgi:predicted O-methyltransferase YrrM
MTPRPLGRRLQELRTHRTSGILTSRDLKRVMRTEGMIDALEAQELARLAAATDGQHAIVEVGSWRGRSTVALALGALRGQKASVFAIDPHEEFTGLLGGQFGNSDRTHFFRNLLGAGVVEQVRLINASSELIAPGWSRPIGTLWIDGDHSYEGVARDVRCWEPHVVSGGSIVFHDATNPTLGPIQVIEELTDTSRFERTCAVKNMVILNKLH